MRRIPLVLALLLTAACGDGGSGPSTSASEQVRVLCGSEGARVLTPSVRALPDGLHVEITNETGRGTHVGFEQGSSGGDSVLSLRGTSEHVLALAPGKWSVACYDVGGGQGGTFELVDTGLWVSTELDDCELPEITHGDPPRTLTVGEEGLVEHARRGLESFTTLESGDVIEPAGYPEQRAAIFRARRDGRTVATISFFPADGGMWTEGEVTSCVD